MDSAAIPRLAAAILSRLGPARGFHALDKALTDPLLAALLWRVLRDEMALDRALLDQGMALAYASPLPLSGPLPQGQGPALTHARQGDPLAPLLHFLTGSSDV
jgi:hypothetical protein